MSDSNGRTTKKRTEAWLDMFKWIVGGFLGFVVLYFFAPPVSYFTNTFKCFVGSNIGIYTTIIIFAFHFLFVLLFNNVSNFLSLLVQNLSK